MSLTSRQAEKARSITLDDDQGSGPAPVRVPRTAPGQLMDLQGKYASAKDRIKELESLLAQGQSLEIPLEELHSVPGRRRKLSDEQFSELVENLRNNPLVQAITVRPRAEGGFEIVSGHNRVEAFRILGRSTITAVGLETNDDLVELSAFYANLLQPSLPDYEKYLGFKRRQLQTGKSQVELAAEAGVPATSVSDLFSFDRLPAEALAHLEVKPHILGSKAATKLAQAAESGNGQLVIEAVQMLAKDSRYTQAQAVAHASRAKAQSAAARTQPRVVKNGKQTFCKIQTRGNRIVVDFASSIGEDEAVEWAKQFEQYVREKMKGSHS
jgi:ParB family chromosome partitioning protein